MEGRGHRRTDQQRLDGDAGRQKSRDLGLLYHEIPGAQRGHIIGAVLFHEGDDLVGHEGAVLDRIHAGEDGAFHPLGAVGVDCHLQPVFVGRLDDRLDLLAGHLRALGTVAQAEHAARGHDLDHIGAVLHVVAHGGARTVGAVENFRLGKQADDLVAVAVGAVGVAAGCPDGGAGGIDARALDPAGGDRLA